MTSTSKKSSKPQPIERANVSDAKPLSYKKFDLDFSSDEDDCHPNIEINTWRRLKERMRKEKGIKKREPYLVDKWNTVIKNEKYAIDPHKPPLTTDTTVEPEIKEDDDQKKVDQKINQNQENIESEEIKEDELKQDSNNKPKTTATTTSTTSAPTKIKNRYQNAVVNDEENMFNARSDPEIFLNNNLKLLEKFSNIKKDRKANKYLRKHPDLIHEASEGYLITYAVDRAVEGAKKSELKRLAIRCLMVHNLVQSCTQANVSPEKGVSMFYKKMSDERIEEQYSKELRLQCLELLEKIESRRKERVLEAEKEVVDEEPAPLGPGGLDPTEVLNSLPQTMQDAFLSQDIEGLKQALRDMPEEEANVHMQRCISSGLWVQPEDEEAVGNDEEVDVGVEEVDVGVEEVIDAVGNIEIENNL